MGRTESFTERRRRRLSRQASALEVLEARNSVGDLSSPMGLMHRAIAGSGLAAAFAAAWRPRAAEAAVPMAAPRRRDLALDPGPGASVVPVRIAPMPARPRDGLRAAYASLLPPADWPTLTPMPAPGPDSFGGSSPPAADQPAGAGPVRGASEPGGAAARGAITPLRATPRRPAARAGRGTAAAPATAATAARSPASPPGAARWRSTTPARSRSAASTPAPPPARSPTSRSTRSTTTTARCCSPASSRPRG
jgi:hypothetical protein